MSFSGDEEKLIDSVVSVLDSGREKFTFQEVQLQSEIRYKDIIIDLNHNAIGENPMVYQTDFLPRIISRASPYPQSRQDKPINAVIK